MNENKISTLHTGAPEYDKNFWNLVRGAEQQVATHFLLWLKISFLKH